MADLTSQWVAAMRTGRYAEAWAISAGVLARRDPATRDDPAVAPHLRWVWDGRDVGGRDVLVRCYHGLGDTVQFARYLPALAARARSVTIVAQPRLAALLRTMHGAAHWRFANDGGDDPARVALEITELDFVLRRAPDTFATPYLHVAPQPLPPATVGLCYDAGAWDGDRRIPPAALAPLCDIADCVTLVPEATALPVLNPQGCPFDMMRTAALVAGTALVVTTDTMIAHLAAALGRPTWVLLKAAPDWRWSPERRDTAWYPDVVTYVQPQPGDWATVLARVADDLVAWTSSQERQGNDRDRTQPDRPGVVGRIARQDLHP